MGRHPTAESVSTLGKQRDNLVRSLAKFNADSRKYMGLDAFNECVPPALSQTDFDYHWDPTDPAEIPPGAERPETFVIALPSALPQISNHRTLLTRFMLAEMELRKGHANDCLSSMRRTIGQEAFQYKKILQPAYDKIHQTRARTSIQAVHRGVVLQAQIYTRTRNAMLNLGFESETVTLLYRELTKDDIQVTSAVSKPNEPGSTQHKLSWIWTVHQGAEPTDNHLTECAFFYYWTHTD